MRNKDTNSALFCACAALFALAAFATSGASTDTMRGPALKDVRLEGWLGAKMDRFISRRLVDPFMRGQVFDEARQSPWRTLQLKGAKKHANGLWFVKEMRLEGADKKWKTQVKFDHAEINSVGD